MGRQTRESAQELRAVAALVVGGELVGPCTLVGNGLQVVAFSSAELLRGAGESLEIALVFDGTRRLPVASWTIGRSLGLGILELGAPFPADERLDVAPLSLSAVLASLGTRGAPASLVTIAGSAGGWSRRVVPVNVDEVDAGAAADSWVADDPVAQLATTVDAADAGASIEGAPLFAWLPPDAVLGRDGEVVVAALAVPDRARAFAPRGAPPIAQLVGLDDLSRALPWTAVAVEGSNELEQVAGEIRDVPSGPTGLGRKR